MQSSFTFPELNSNEDFLKDIYNAALGPEEKAIQSLLKKHNIGIDVQHQNNTPICMLAFNGKIDAVNFLIEEFNASLNWAVYGYAKKGNNKEIAILLEKYAKEDAVKYDGLIQRAVYGFSQSNHDELAEEIIRLTNNPITKLALYQERIKGLAQQNTEKANEKINEIFNAYKNFKTPFLHALIMGRSRSTTENNFECALYDILMREDNPIKQERLFIKLAADYAFQGKITELNKLLTNANMVKKENQFLLFKEITWCFAQSGYLINDITLQNITKDQRELVELHASLAAGYVKGGYYHDANLLLPQYKAQSPIIKDVIYVYVKDVICEYAAKGNNKAVKTLLKKYQQFEGPSIYFNIIMQYFLYGFNELAIRTLNNILPNEVPALIEELVTIHLERNQINAVNYLLANKWLNYNEISIVRKIADKYIALNAKAELLELMKKYPAAAIFSYIVDAPQINFMGYQPILFEIGTADKEIKYDYSLLYGNEAVITDYDEKEIITIKKPNGNILIKSKTRRDDTQPEAEENQIEIIPAHSSLFKKQLLMLLQKFSQLYVDDPSKDNFAAFKIKLFKESFTGEQSDSYFGILKILLEKVYLLLNTTSTNKKREILKELSDIPEICPPGIIIALQNLVQYLLPAYSLEDILTETRKSIIDSFVTAHIAINHVPAGMQRHVESRVVKYANEEKNLRIRYENKLEDEFVESKLLNYNTKTDQAFYLYFTDNYRPHQIIITVINRLIEKLQDLQKSIFTVENHHLHSYIIDINLEPEKFKQFTEKAEALFKKWNLPLDLTFLVVVEDDYTQYKIHFDDLKGKCILYFLTTPILFQQTFLRIRDFNCLLSLINKEQRLQFIKNFFDTNKDLAFLKERGILEKPDQYYDITYPISLVEYMSNNEEKDAFQTTMDLLTTAAEKAECLKLFLAHQVISWNTFATTLINAIKKGEQEFATALINLSSDEKFINTSDTGKKEFLQFFLNTLRDAFIICINNNNLELINILLQRDDAKDFINLVNDEGYNALGCAHLYNENLIDVLVKKGAVLQFSLSQQCYLFITAVKKNDLKLTRLLMNTGSKAQDSVVVRTLDNEGCTALQYAFKENNAELVQILLQHENLSLYNPEILRDFLIKSIENNNIALVTILLERMDDKKFIHLADSKGYTALEYAVKHNNTEIIKLLFAPKHHLHSNAEILLRCLITSIRHESIDAIKILLEIESCPTWINLYYEYNDGTALLNAVKTGNRKIVELLLKKKANPVAANCNVFKFNLLYKNKNSSDQALMDFVIFNTIDPFRIRTFIIKFTNVLKELPLYRKHLFFAALHVKAKNYALTKELINKLTIYSTNLNEVSVDRKCRYDIAINIIKEIENYKDKLTNNANGNPSRYLQGLNSFLDSNPATLEMFINENNISKPSLEFK